MRYKHPTFLLAYLLVGFWLVFDLAILPTPVQARQQNAPSPYESGGVIRKDTSLVLVDAIVTDKKGNYIRNLKMEDFRVAEDGKEQAIKSFSVENGDVSSLANGRKRYLVILFDDSSMTFDEQARSRVAALNFVESVNSENQLIAITSFKGTLQVVENYTRNFERLKRAITGGRTSLAAAGGDTVSTTITAPSDDRDISDRSNRNEAATSDTPLSGPQMQQDFRARTLLLALRSLAERLSSDPGRKTLVLFSSGFPLTPELRAELTAAIDACNKANLAIYPLDARGLSLTMPAVTSWADPVPNGSAIVHASNFSYVAAPFFRNSLMMPASYRPALTAMFQRAPGTGPRTPPGQGGQTGTGSGGTGSKTPPPANRTPGSVRPDMVGNPYKQPSRYKPWFSGENGATTNQNVLYALAEGTGGFVIVNTNDLLGGLNKIAEEQNEYYMLGYRPSPSEPGSCHTLKVKVTQADALVRARSGYCNVAPVDSLAGTPVQDQLERQLTNAQATPIAASMAAAFFYAAANTARVNLTLEIPPEAMKLDKEKGKTFASINVLGIAYRPDASVAARFSDTVKIALESKADIEEFRSKPFHYEKQFEIASGQYELKVVFSSGADKFGRLESPLSIDRYSPDEFSLSAIVFSKQTRKIAESGDKLEQEVLQNHTPLVSRGIEFIPSGTKRFQKTDAISIFVEIYQPLLMRPNPPKVAIQYVLVDRNTKELKFNTGLVAMEALLEPGNPVIAAGLKLPLESIPPGSYRLELRASESTGKSRIRFADFELQ